MGRAWCKLQTRKQSCRYRVTGLAACGCQFDLLHSALCIWRASGPFAMSIPPFLMGWGRSRKLHRGGWAAHPKGQNLFPAGSQAMIEGGEGAPGRSPDTPQGHRLGDTCCFWNYTCAKIGVPNRTASGTCPNRPQEEKRGNLAQPVPGLQGLQGSRDRNESG